MGSLCDHVNEPLSSIKATGLAAVWFSKNTLLHGVGLVT